MREYYNEKSKEKLTGGLSPDERDEKNAKEKKGKTPILLDLDGNGLTITKLDDSDYFFDIGGDGYKHRSAWVGAGDGVLVFDADGDGKISNRKEVVLTDWDPSADSDMEALRQVFDTNGNGLLDAGDAQWQQFKVMVTKQDGTTIMKTLTELGIESLTLVANETRYEFSDGSSIDGEATFTRTDGTTGTAATATLMIDAQGYAATATTTTDANGETTTVTRAVDAQGAVASETTRITSADGLTTTTRFDLDGDGVVDRVVTDVLENMANGSRRHTETVRSGAGVLNSSTATVTSSDQRMIQIDRDQLGGGFTTESETRLTGSDNSLTVTIAKRAQDGSTISSERTEFSGDRLSRTDRIDLDGNLTYERSATSATIRNTDGSIVKRDSIRGGGGNLLSEAITDISADGLVRSERTDANGDGLVDRVTSSTTSRNLATGQTVIDEQAHARDGSSISKTLTTVSADGLNKSTSTDLDGDGTFDRVTSDITVIGSDQSRTQTVTTVSADGSLLSKTITVRAADGLTGSKSIDANGDGVFEQVTTVTKASDGKIIQTTKDYSADGVLLAKVVATTNANGLSTTTNYDHFGLGSNDQSAIDYTTKNADGSAQRSIERKSNDGTRLERIIINTSADGLVLRERNDTDGDGQTNLDILDSTVVQADGSQTRTIKTRAGNGALLSGETIKTSSDRRLVTHTADTDGDGQTNVRQTTQTAADGSKVFEEERLTDSGVLIAKSRTTTSANGLVQNTERDLDGNGTIDNRGTNSTVLDMTGGKTTTIRSLAGDGLLLSEEVSSQSGNGLLATTTRDFNGDGIADESVRSETSLDANGSTTVVVTQKRGTATVGTETRRQSANGLLLTVERDLNGDGVVDRAERTSKQLLASGALVETGEVRSADHSLISLQTTETSANGRLITTTIDRNGDGHTDRSQVRELLSDGAVRVTTTERDASGTVKNTAVETTSRNGLTATLSIDDNGDGTTDRTRIVEKTVQADGTEVRVVTENAGVSTLVERSTTMTSGNGLQVSTVWTDAAGTTTRSMERLTTLSMDGRSETVETYRKADGSIESTETLSKSGNGNSSILSSDTDGDGNVDYRVTENHADNGETTQLYENLKADGTAAATKLITVSANGLIVTAVYDSNGDGIYDRRVVSKSEPLANGSTQKTVTTEVMTNGSWQLNGKEITLEAGDGLTVSKQWDDTGSGAFGLIRTTTTALAANGSRTTTERTVSTGSAIRIEESVVSADGLSITHRLDLNADGAFDQTATDITTLHADGSRTRTETSSDANGVVLSSRATSLSKDGLSSTSVETSNIQGWVPRSTSIVTELLADGGSRTMRTVKNSASQLMEVETRTASGDGRSITIEVDRNGDGVIDQRTVETKYLDGRISSVETNLGAGGIVSSRVSSLTSADGLRTVIETDKNGDGTVDLRKTTVQQDFADGSSKLVTTVINVVTGVTKSRTEETVSADGSLRTETTDVNGDGTADQVVKEEILASGSRKITVTNNAAARASSEIRAGEIYWNDTVPAATETVISADGQTRNIRLDNDGDGRFELEISAVNQIDGSVKTTMVEKNADGSTKAKGTLVQSADGRLSVLNADTQNDGVIDLTTTASIGIDGAIEKTSVKRNASGVVTETKKSQVDALGNLLSEETFDGSNRRIELFTRQSDLTTRRTQYEASNGAVKSVENFTEAGTITSAVLYDALNNQTWSRVEQTYDSAGKKTTEKHFLDNGTTAVITFVAATGAQQHIDYFNAAGQRTGSVDFDVANSQVWRQVDRTYDTAGRTLTQIEYRDNGARIETTYDLANTRSWSRYINQFDTAGRLEYVHQLNDDSSWITVNYDPANTANWSSIQTQYDGANRPTFQVYYYDNGNRAEIVFDPTNTQYWTNVTYTYDGSNRLLEQSILQDDSIRVTTYYDVNESQPYSWGVRTYAQNGNLISDHSYTNGGGRSYKNIYDAYNNQTWTRKQEYYEGTTLFYTETWYDNGKYEKTGASGTPPIRDSHPVVFDLNGDATVSILPIAENDVSFDWDGDGITDPTAWVGPEDGMLVIDLASDGSAGGDGSIDQAREIAFSMWPEDAEANPVSDLQGLRIAFDSNGDNILDSQDARWSEFRIWQDLNQNGVSDAGELRTMSEAGVKLINLLPVPDGATTFADGSAITGTSYFETADGLKHLAADASFRFHPSRTDVAA